MDKPIAFITGATSGIGLATAKALSKTYNLILCGRRVNRLEELKNELSSLTGVKTLGFDVSKQVEVDRACNSLSADWKKIDVLINNAGNAHGLDVIQEGSIEDWDNMMDINVKGLLYVSRLIIPQMVLRKTGHIINIGSTAGKEVYPKGNVYCASKHAVDAISSGMRIDLNPYGIKVTQICPGLVNTEFSNVRFKGDSKKADNVYTGITPLFAEDIAETVLFCVTRPPHVNIADMIVMPTDQASSAIVNRTSNS